MRYYETLYLIKPDLPDEELKGVVSKFGNVFEKNACVTIKVEEWGRRGLAYNKKGKDKGFYVLVRYCGAPGVTREVERELRLDDRVLMFQTVKLQDEADPEALKQQEAKPATEVAAEGAEGAGEQQEGAKDGRELR
jgi:small subunit ribosomal protein S6